jgi:hypothetical protein
MNKAHPAPDRRLAGKSTSAHVRDNNDLRNWCAQRAAIRSIAYLRHWLIPNPHTPRSGRRRANAVTDTATSATKPISATGGRPSWEPICQIVVDSIKMNCPKPVPPDRFSAPLFRTNHSSSTDEVLGTHRACLLQIYWAKTRVRQQMERLTILRKEVEWPSFWTSAAGPETIYAPLRSPTTTNGCLKGAHQVARGQSRILPRRGPTS